ncbi:AraC family transcriptional regulator [Limibacter armeniacum]|uniref:helix-turn-helix domain-containing protein n=1 Tax=Limibacter armeniacum TaxID=466084 RepID=UPI002FE514C9
MFFEKIPLTEKSPYLIRTFEVAYMDYPMHCHPEMELTLVEGSEGTRFIGDNMAPIGEMDLVLLGPNVPHQWRNTIGQLGKLDTFRLTVLHFDPVKLGKEWLEFSSMYHIRQLFHKAERGVLFGKQTIDLTKPLLAKLKASNQFESFLAFFQLLDCLSTAKDIQLLSSPLKEKAGADLGYKRIQSVMDYLHCHFQQNLSIGEVAEQVNMSVTAFAHFFKRRTGMTFSAFVNELRIGHVTKQLVTTDKQVAEICYEAGFSNLSYFNKVFRNIHGMSPRTFRSLYHQPYMSGYDQHFYLEKK